MDVSVPIQASLSSVHFSFISNESHNDSSNDSNNYCKRLSVKAINNPQTFDPITNHPMTGGVYDPALGPSDDRNQLCVTCKLNYFNCPGHFGHVELAVCAYQPLLFNQLFTLLRSCCFYCHQLKMKDVKVHRYRARLLLAMRGLVLESMELESLDFSSILNVTTRAEEEEEDTNDNDKQQTPVKHASNIDREFIIHAIDEYVKDAINNANSNDSNSNSNDSSMLTNDYMKRLIKDFMAKASLLKTCENCGGRAASLRKESHSKIFASSLSRKDQSIMEAKGLIPHDVLSTPNTPVTTSPNTVTPVTTSPVTNTTTSNSDGITLSKQKLITPMQAKEHLRLLWERERAILDLIFGYNNLNLNSNSNSNTKVSCHSQFFLDTILVPPSRFRPQSRLGDKVFDHPQNTYLVDIIKYNNQIVELRKTSETNDNTFKQIINAWIGMQEQINNLIDSTKNPKSKKAAPGIKQIMEKKEGLFRQNMMGKRVNFAARSVISPDPMIETSEIGIPLVFAKRLTYPEPVNHLNYHEMRQAVINGPEQHPGAVSIVNEDGSMTMLQGCSLEQRTALANQLLTPPSNTIHSSVDVKHLNKKVNRHLRDGDMLLLNRQPTLHKPSIMGHRARVLSNEKTIRMHYANCNTYNADFDGDEMNVHFPQNPLAQAEARMIMNTNNQYLVPTSGEPLRGLIQDHVVVGVLMTSKQTFLSRLQYTQLLYGCLPNVNRRLRLLPPAVQKPRQLWTGKQMISTLLMNLTHGQKQLNLDSRSQVPSKAWSVMQCNDTEEGDVVLRDGELVTGVLDKKQFGAKAFGLVHACYELYGGDTAGRLLTALGRLFTNYSQMIGFTCRMDDLLVLKEADDYRRLEIDKVLKQGKEILREYSQSNETSNSSNATDGQLEKRLRDTLNSKHTSSSSRQIALKALKALEERRLFSALEETIRSDQKLAQLDSQMKSKTSRVTTAIVKALLPNGLIKPFPDNGMQLMTVSGAKGSNVNVTQISCMLGQQELEGRRVPVMVSGKTLPSFRPFDLGPRAGGYITGRFLTGIRPQEYYFHCMAGREGLVDTAVKTARSGYLQRCLIKHLEGMKINYDSTVRDCSDGSIYQFHYGEDGLDVIKQSHLERFTFNAMNYRAFCDKYDPQAASRHLDCETAVKRMRKVIKRQHKYDPVLSLFHPGVYLGAVSEHFQFALDNYIQQNPDGLLLTDANDDDSSHKSNKPVGELFEALMHLKYIHSLADAGEAVGLLAAQSIGEPSTQMTLNTFHFAGHGAKNVTLGIPRLREIIMTASTKPKTPQMTIPLLGGCSKESASAIAKRITRLTLDLLMQKAVVTEQLLSRTQSRSQQRCKGYTVRLEFMPNKEYQQEFGVGQEQLQQTLEKRFIKRLIAAIQKELKTFPTKQNPNDDNEDAIGKGQDVSKFNESNLNNNNTSNNTEENDSKKQKSKIKSIHSDDEEEGDMDATAITRSLKHKQRSTYDAPDAEEIIDDEAEEVSDKESNTDSEEDSEEEEEQESNSNAIITNERREKIVTSNQFVFDYRFDDSHGQWCEFDLEMPADTKKILMIGLIESICPHCVVREVPQISKCFVNESTLDSSLSLITEGVNIRGLFDLDPHLNVSKIESNDIYSIINTFGIEAGRQTIINEISAVFAVYGIEVDKRHLTLIADYMTFEGGYKPFNRIGIENSASPFAKMSFETTFSFLTQACLRGDTDYLNNPSARIVMGQVVESGTGSFDLLQKIN